MTIQIPPKQDVIASLRDHHGMIGLAGEEFGVSYETFRRWLDHYDLSDEPKKVRDLTIEKIKSTAYGRALKGDKTMLIFILKTQAGWTETQRIDQRSFNVNVDRSAAIASPEDQAKYIAEVAAELDRLRAANAGEIVDGEVIENE